MSLSKFKNVRHYLLIFILALCLSGCGSISDGEYAASVALSGGSGKAYIESPCKVTVKGGKAVADIIWSSSNYDYMIVDGNTYYPVSTEYGSEFEIPIVLGKEMAVQADTTAMSTAHLIDYTLLFTLGDDEQEHEEETQNGFVAASMEAPDITGLQYLSTDESSFAEGFRIHRYEDGYAVIAVEDGRNYMIVPKDSQIPAGLNADMIVIQKPLSSIYLAASAVMCQFDSIGAVDRITLSGTKRDDWYIDSARDAMDSGAMLYGGKYSAPDYEMMMEKSTELAVENTMILHTPKVIEKLEKLGIPTFIDRSSYESEPLGRLEWIRVYGLLCDREEEAGDAFEEQKRLAEGIDLNAVSGKSVAVFSVNSSHQIVTKKRNDYFVKMIEKAGGTYLAPDIESDEKAASQVNVSIEAFYDYAREADILIYNGTIQDPPKDIDELSKMDVTFGDFKAVGTGDVWVCEKSLYQFANRTGSVISDLYEVIREGKETTEFFYKLK